MKVRLVGIFFYLILLVVLGVNMYAVLSFSDIYNMKVTLIGDCVAIIILGSMVLSSKPKKKTGKEKVILVRKAK
jgi:hypothetical protein